MGIVWNSTAQPSFASGPVTSSATVLATVDSPAPAGSQDQGAGAASPARFGLALTLGGGEVRLLDLTAAYGSLANGGRRLTPVGISTIETLDGKVLWDGRQEANSTLQSRSGAQTDTHTPAGPAGPVQAVDPRVAYLITDILSDDDVRLPAFGPGNVLEIGRPAAAKTGTTTDWRDNWTVGYTPDLVTGVWVGNPDNTPMLDISGITGAGPIWHDFMYTVLRDMPPHDFVRPDGLVRVEVCADSGLLPGSDDITQMNQVGDRQRRCYSSRGPLPRPPARMVH